MEQWIYKVFTLTVVGVVYLVFSKDDSLYYHFLELFAGLAWWAGGTGSFENGQGGKKEMEQWKTEVGWFCFVPGFVDNRDDDGLVSAHLLAVSNGLGEPWLFVIIPC